MKKPVRSFEATRELFSVLTLNRRVRPENGSDPSVPPTIKISRESGPRTEQWRETGCTSVTTRGDESLATTSTSSKTFFEFSSPPMTKRRPSVNTDDANLRFLDKRKLGFGSQRQSRNSKQSWLVRLNPCPPVPNAINILQACIYKSVNTGLFLKSLLAPSTVNLCVVMIHN